jgi:hypothetical protein
LSVLLVAYASRYSDSLRAGRSGDRISVVTKFSAPVQTGSEAQPASYTMETGSFPGVKQPGRDVDHPPHSYLTTAHRYPALLSFKCYPLTVEVRCDLKF